MRTGIVSHQRKIIPLGSGLRLKCRPKGPFLLPAEKWVNALDVTQDRNCEVPRSRDASSPTARMINRSISEDTRAVARSAIRLALPLKADRKSTRLNSSHL